MSKDYYKILDLTEEDKKLTGEAFEKKLKENYRKLAKQFHPDKFANKSEEERKEAEEKFKDITEAYDTLNDSKKRQQYDQFGTTGNFDFEGFGSTGMDDIDEMLNRFRRGFSPFGGIGGFDGMEGGFFRSRQYSAGIQKPQPLKLRLHVSIRDIYEGKTKAVKYKHFVPCHGCGGNGFGTGGHVDTCPVCGGKGVRIMMQHSAFATIQQTVPCDHCGGTGQVVTNPCKSCNGSGREVVTDQIEITLPVGSCDGAYFNVEGRGNCAERNGNIVGDVVVEIVVDPDENFSINNRFDVLTTVEVPVLDCITGGKAEVQLVDGKKINITIPKFTRDGKIMQLAGYGLPNGNGRGRLLMKIVHKFPTDLTSSEEKTLNELKKSKNFK